MKKYKDSFVGSWIMEDNPCLYMLGPATKKVTGSVMTERGMTQIVVRDDSTDGLMEIVTNVMAAKELAEQILRSINNPDGDEDE